MTPCKTFMVLGLASVSLFSFAQELIAPGNSLTPHSVPIWFVRMASPDRRIVPELDSFVYQDSNQQPMYGRVVVSNPKYVCKIEVIEGRIKWQFCDM